MSFWRWFSLVWRFEGLYSICLCVRQSDFGVYQAWPNIERNVSIAQREMCPLHREEHVHCAERNVSTAQRATCPLRREDRVHCPELVSSRRTSQMSFCLVPSLSNSSKYEVNKPGARISLSFLSHMMWSSVWYYHRCMTGACACLVPCSNYSLPGNVCLG